MARLPIAVRAYAERLKKRKARRKASWIQEIDWSRDVVVFDTETTIDKTQQLTFGSYRVGRWSADGSRLECREEGLFYADSLPKTDPEGFALLQEYAKSRRAQVAPDCPDSIQLLSRSEFAEEVLYQV